MVATRSPLKSLPVPESHPRAVRMAATSPSVCSSSRRSMSVTISRVALNTGTGAVIAGVAEALVAPVPHTDGELLAALPRHRRQPAVGAQRLVVSLGQGSPALSKHRGGDDSSHSRQGPEDSRVTVLAGNLFGAEFLQQRLHSGRYLGSLRVE